MGIGAVRTPARTVVNFSFPWAHRTRILARERFGLARVDPLRLVGRRKTVLEGEGAGITGQVRDLEAVGPHARDPRVELVPVIGILPVRPLPEFLRFLVGTRLLRRRELGLVPGERRRVRLVRVTHLAAVALELLVAVLFQAAGADLDFPLLLRRRVGADEGTFGPVPPPPGAVL